MDRDRGAAAMVELLFLLAAGVVAIAFIAGAGRARAAAVDVDVVAQAAARAASLAADADGAPAAAQDVVDRSSLITRCRPAPSVAVVTIAGPAGSWPGGSVSVRITCRVDLARRGGGLANLPDGLVVAEATEVVDAFRP